MSVNYQLLLEKAARLYERHEAGRRDPFNVFSVLRTEHDEVNLHSRFLAALLDYRQPSDGHRENLKDFLCTVGIRDLKHEDATVGREIDNVDILIRDSSSAVVIENKIWAGDQPKQLERYAKQQKREGYEKPHLLYLTLDGHDPSEDSVGDLNLECISLKCISYKEHLSPWLERCQQRAVDEPALRESVAQYLRLIAKLTGTDYSEAYMSDLKKLCLQDNNLVLVHDLNKAMVEARVSLLLQLWQEIECKLREEISDLPEKSEVSDISEERIRRFVTYQRSYRVHGLYFGFGRYAKLGVEVGDSIFFGVKCWQKESEDEHNKLREELEKALKGGRSEEWWPWMQDAPPLNLKYPNRKDLELLANEKKRQEYAAEVASGVGEVWEKIKKAGLA